MGDILVLIIVGLVVGVLARSLMPGHDSVGILGTILIVDIQTNVVRTSDGGVTLAPFTA